MSFMPDNRSGYYDERGRWQRTKLCFVNCGALCDCGPPMGVWQRAPDVMRAPSIAEMMKWPIDLEPKKFEPSEHLKTMDTQAHIEALAKAVVKDAELYGLVVTIECVPLEPLAMGNHHMVVSVREARKLAEAPKPAIISGCWE